VDVEIVEEQCERLARKNQFISSKGVESWPDGTIGGRYSFLHALYQNVLYERVAEARRVRLHRALGMRKEQAYGTRAREIAGELAAHFAAGRDMQRVVKYSRQAADTAVRRHAHQEATIHLSQGLGYLRLLPDTPERARQELMLQLSFGEQLTSIKGFRVEEVEQAFARALELCRRLGETPQMFRVLLGLWAFYVEREELVTARALAEQLLRLSQQVQTSALLVWANLTMGITLHFAGEQVSARRHLEECLALYNPQDFRQSASPYDSAVLGLATLGPTLWLLGYPDQALFQKVEEAPMASRRGVDELVASEETPLTGFTDAGELLDPQARLAYRQRLAELEGELVEAQDARDEERLHTLQEEKAFLLRELSQAVGLGGRVRKAGSAAERARINVTKAIKNSIKRIGKSHPALGRHLTQTMKTGVYCVYTPNPHPAITWKT
jgi:hypothetical protein